MRRRLLVIVIFLLAGAVVNVAVAWVCVARVANQMLVEEDDPEKQVGIWPPNRPHWEVERWTYCGYTLLTSGYDEWIDWGDEMYIPSYRPTEEWLPLWARCRRPFQPIEGWRHDPLAGPYGGLLVENAAGWPFLSVRSSHRWKTVPGPPLIDQISGVFRPTWRYEGPRVVLPYLPIWPGFAINTLVYATVLWLLISSSFALRQFLRVKSGRCPKCAYPTGASPICSECGKPLPKRAVA